MKDKKYITLVTGLLFLGLFLNNVFAVTCDYYIYNGTTNYIYRNGTYCLASDIYCSNFTLVNISATVNVTIYGNGYKIYGKKCEFDVFSKNSSIKLLDVHGGVFIGIGNYIKQLIILNSSIEEIFEFDKPFGSIGNVYIVNSTIEFGMCLGHNSKRNVVIENSYIFTNNNSYGGVFILANGLYINNSYIYITNKTYEFSGFSANYGIINNSSLIKITRDFWISNVNISFSTIVNKYHDAEYYNVTFYHSNVSFYNNTLVELCPTKFLYSNVSFVNIDFYYPDIPERIIIYSSTIQFTNSSLVLPYVYGFHQYIYIDNSTIIYKDNNSKILVNESNCTINISNSKIIGGKYGIYFNKICSGGDGYEGVIIKNTYICNNEEYSIYYAGTSSRYKINITDSCFDKVYPNVSIIKIYPDHNFYCNGTPRFGHFNNELHLYGYFDLTQNTTLNIKPDEPYKFDISKLPFKFELDKAVITINKIVILPVKQILNTETNPTSYYERHEDSWNSGFGGGTVSFSYLGGISGNYKYTLGLSTFGGSKYVYYTYFVVPLKQQVGFDNQITIHIKLTGKETLTLNKPLVSPTTNERGIIPIITVFVKNLYTGETEMYGILPNYGALGDLKSIVDEYLQKYPFKSIVRLDYPLSTQGYDFTFNLNSLLNLNSINYKLEGVNIGVLSIIYQPDATTVVFSNKKFELENNILDNLIKTQALFNNLEVDGSFTVTTLEITAYKPQQEITQPPFYGLRINGNEVYTKTVTLTNISTLEISSENNIILYGSLRIYGTIKVLFNKINDYTYSAYLRYNYSTPFNLLNVVLYQLPNKITKIIKQEYYINGTTVTWIKIWNETQKYEDITYMFNLTDTTQGYTYTLKSEYYTVFFDPTNGAKLQSTRFGDEVYNITYYTIDVPDVSIGNVLFITNNNTLTNVDVEILSDNVNVTNNVTVSLQIICENKTYLTQKQIIISPSQNKTIVSFNVIKFVSEIEKSQYCKVIVNVSPELDVIKSNNEKSIVVYINVVNKSISGDITVTVYDAKTQIKLSNVTVNLYYINGTYITNATTDINGTATFSNISYGFYIIKINESGFKVFNVTFLHSSSNTMIYAYLIPTTINTTTEGILQVCLYYNDLEPIEEYPVNVYNETGSLIATFKVNSTGCGSIVLPIGNYTVSTTLPNNERLTKTIYAKPYDQGYSEVILKSSTLSSGRITPEVAIIYAEILHMEGESNAKYPVIVFLYSSIPQNITLQVVLQKYVNGTWQNVQTKTVNISFTEYKQTKEQWVVFDIYNETGFSEYRAVVSIMSYENDTNTSNNVFTTQNVTIHIQIDVGVIVIPKQVYVKPGENIELELKTFGNVNLNNKITITITYYDPLQNKTLTTTKEITLETNKNITINQTVPYAPNITITTEIYPINYEKVDINPQNNKYNVKIDVAPDVRIKEVIAPDIVQSGGYALIKVKLISNKQVPVIVSINNKTDIFTVNMGYDEYSISYEVPELSILQPVATETFTITLSGDESEEGNTASISITVVNPTFIYTVIGILLIISIIIIMLKVLPRIITRKMIKPKEEFKYFKVRRK